MRPKIEKGFSEKNVTIAFVYEIDYNLIISNPQGLQPPIEKKQAEKLFNSNCRPFLMENKE